VFNYKIYLSDEVCGHIVRQKAILEKLYDYSNTLFDYTLQNQYRLKSVKDIFGK
jgi:spore coat polysaccharide biosynthesis predicted glycosyltransferase SpsG